ncbi:o-succinylbenzoate synthase [Arcticibacter tournemirensis]|uniref:Dipeptide epimerase n=1 Tax=Arcticibacter tournemirensis TaxID=699437 RepID=A0A5M9HHD3_9SPHI|nr:dipeptide epimerase [Arcticibacter tournemirensis]KAA8485855.1 dipeptide epimerase [Arcticibacter tournemirensis]TQM46896.1 o-succinylbenzoate synthase [Arcticibacter tournemirensis]
MIFTSFEIYKYSIPIEPFVIATGTMYYAQNVFVRAHTDAGITGVGECSAFPMIVGETQATCFEMAKDFAAIWKGKDATDIEARLNELDLYAAGNYTAKSAFDMLLYDLAAKKAGMPLCQFLGGRKRTITTDLTIGIDTPEAMAAKALEYTGRGVAIIKVKLGKQPIEDIERVKQIRRAVGPQTELRADANQGWTFDEAVYALKALAEYDVRFCEQPMRKWDDQLLPELGRISPVPIMADESVYTHHDAKRIIENKAASYINIKFAKSGGIREAIKINEVAEINGVQCMIGSMLESRLALTANVHFAMAHKNVVFFDLDTCLLGQLEDPVLGGVEYAGMDLHVTDAPGIGADVDQSYLDKCVAVII